MDDCLVCRVEWNGFIYKMRALLTSVDKNAQHSTFGPALKWMLNKSDRKVLDWINLAQERDRRRAVVNRVINLRVP